MSKRSGNFDNTDSLTPEDSKKLSSLISIFPHMSSDVIQNLLTSNNFDSELTVQAILDSSTTQEGQKETTSPSPQSTKSLSPQATKSISPQATKNLTPQTKKQVIVIDDEDNPNKQKLDNPSFSPKDTKKFGLLTKADREIFQKFNNTQAKEWVDEGTDREIAKQLQSALDEENLRQKVKNNEERVRGTVLPLEHGVVLFKNCLSEDEQIGIYHQCQELGKDIQKSFQGSFQLQGQSPFPVLYYNWNGYGQGTNELREPKDLLQFGSDMFKRVHQLSKTLTAFKAWDDNQDTPALKFPSSYNPNALYGIIYPEKSKLASHQDGAMGWVLSVSIGDSALFFYSLVNGKDKIEIRIDSGDVVIFNGQKLFHGVSKIYPNTAPKFWEEMEGKLGNRFNLQFRDPKQFGMGIV